MDRARLAAQLEIDEGRRLAVYADTRGNLTVGIGHLVLASDHLTLHQPITSLQCAQYLAHDIETAWHGVLTLWPHAEALPEIVQQVLANMCFNMGLKTLSTFNGLIAAVDHRDWQAAATHMEQSRWYAQVGRRAERLTAWMRAMPTETR